MAGNVITKREYAANLKRCELQIANLARLFALDAADMAELQSYYPLYEDVVSTTQLVLDKYISLVSILALRHLENHN